MATDQTIYSDMPIPPGEYLEEALDELAKRMNHPASKLSAIANQVKGFF